MKALLTVLLIFAISTPVLAGYQPPKTGGPNSSRGGGGTRVLTPALEPLTSVASADAVLRWVTKLNHGF
jgi:hypothetical protein